MFVPCGAHHNTTFRATSPLWGTSKLSANPVALSLLQACPGPTQSADSIFTLHNAPSGTMHRVQAKATKLNASDDNPRVSAQQSLMVQIPLSLTLTSAQAWYGQGVMMHPLLGSGFTLSLLTQSLHCLSRAEGHRKCQSNVVQAQPLIWANGHLTQLLSLPCDNHAPRRLLAAF
jgi:hypothetical protein